MCEGEKPIFVRRNGRDGCYACDKGIVAHSYPFAARCGQSNRTLYRTEDILYGIKSWGARQRNVSALIDSLKRCACHGAETRRQRHVLRSLQGLCRWPGRYQGNCPIVQLPARGPIADATRHHQVETMIGSRDLLPD